MLFGVFASLFTYLNRGELRAAGPALAGAQPAFLACGALLTAAVVLNIAAFYRSTYRAVGLAIPFPSMVRLSLASSFVNLISKSGGLAGMSFFLADGRRRGQTGSNVIAAYMLTTLLGHVAFALFLGAGLVVVASGGTLTTPELVAGAIFGVYLAAQGALFVAALRSRTAIRRMYSLPSHVRDVVQRLFGRPTGTRSSDHGAADELFESMRALIRQPRRALLPGIHALLVEALGVLTVWVVLLAFGVHTSIVIPLVAYGLSVLFSIVGVLPAGLGFAEVSMGAVLISSGIPGGVAAVVVATYRLFEVWLPFAVGAVAAQSLAREAPA